MEERACCRVSYFVAGMCILRVGLVKGEAQR